MTYAHVLRSGELKFSHLPTFEGLVISEGHGREWRKHVEVLCRLAYDGHTYLVPGVPEAESDDEAMNAVIKFKHVVAYRFLPEKERKKITWEKYVKKQLRKAGLGEHTARIWSE